MTEFNPIYLTEVEHAALDHTGAPGVPQSGASVGDSLLTAFLASPVVVTDAAGGNFVWDTPDLVGTDLGITGDGDLELLTPGRYQIALDLSLTTDSGASGFLRTTAQFGSGTALPEPSFMSFGNGRLAIPLVPSLTWQTVITLPTDRFATGNVMRLSNYGFLDAGSVTLDTGTMLYVVRVA